MAISFVDSTYSSNMANGQASGTPSVAKPTGVAAGDVLIIAFLAFFGTHGAFTAPSGWTIVRSMESSFGTIELVILKRTADGSEGSTFTMTWASGTIDAYLMACAAYRGASGSFIAQNYTEETQAASPLSTASLSNTDAAAWRITVGAMFTQDSDSPSAPATSETIRREGGTSFTLDSGSFSKYALQYYDSNGPVAVQSHVKSISASGASFWTAVAWMGLLEAGTATPATGTMSMTMPTPGMTLAGEATASGPLSMAISPPTVAMTGEGAPVPASGTFTLALDPPGAALAGAVPPVGVMAMEIPLSLQFYGETRQFGIRVIAVERENRVIRVPSRAVDD